MLTGTAQFFPPHTTLPHLGFSLQAEAAAVGFVVELVVGVHDSPQVDAADLLCGSFVLQVGEQPIDDATNPTFVFQVVHVLCTSRGKETEKERESET